MSYEHLLEEIQTEISREKEVEVKLKLKERIKKMEKVEEVLQVLKKELKQLAKDGKITELNDYIKIDESSGVIVIRPQHSVDYDINTIGILVNK